MRLKAGSEASVREWKESIISDKSLRFAPWAENYLGAPVKGKSRDEPYPERKQNADGHKAALAVKAAAPI